MKLVPTNRLIFVVGLVFLPLSLWVAFMPDKTTLAVLLGGALVALVIFDAFKAPGHEKRYKKAHEDHLNDCFPGEFNEP